MKRGPRFWTALFDTCYNLFMKIWLLSTLISGFMLGVALGTIYDISPATSTFVCLVALAVTLVWRKNSEAVFAPYVLSLSLFLLCLGLGLFRVDITNSQFGYSSLMVSVGKEVILTGKIVEEPQARNTMQQLIVEVGEDIILVSTDRHVDVSYGDIIKVSGVLEEPSSFETDYGRTFDYVGYLKAKGIEYKVSFANVLVIEQDKGNFILAKLFSIKEKLKEGIQKSIEEPAASLGQGLLLGEKQGLGERLEEDFRRTGIVHIVVLSGYNVMLVVTFVIFLLSFVLPQRFRLLFGLVAIVWFALMVGLSATVVRASIMAALLLIAQSLRRTYDVLRALLLAGFVMVIINPYLLIYDVGFQLSFMATLGLILALPYIDSSEKKGILSHLHSYIGATVATQIAVLPLLLFHIGQVSLVAVIVNVLVLPMVPIAMLFTFLVGVFTPFSILANILFGTIATFSLEYIIFIATWWGSLSFAAIEVTAIHPTLVAILYILIVTAYIYLRRANNDEIKPEKISEWTIVEEKEEVSEVPKMFR